MVTKNYFRGILAFVLVFGFYMVGCTSIGPSLYQPINFYNLDDVSEENCAFIQVSPIIDKNDENGWPFADLVRIDGQGNPTQWSIRSDSFWWTRYKAVVRVTPGEHTFEIAFNMSLQNALGGTNLGGIRTVSITYDCQAGKGYYFEFSAIRSDASGLGPTTSVITIYESDVDEDGSFEGYGSGYGSNARIVDRKTETHWMTGF